MRMNTVVVIYDSIVLTVLLFSATIMKCNQLLILTVPIITYSLGFTPSLYMD